MASQVEVKRLLPSSNLARRFESDGQARFDPESGTVVAPDRRRWEFSSSGTLAYTHAIHPYVASMNPHLARELIASLLPPGGRLLDPFAGGGAVLVEAALTGVPAVGTDVNPLACLISRAKTHFIPGDRLRATYQEIVRAYPRTRADPPSFPEHARVEFWFKPYMLDPLSRLAKLVLAVPDIAQRTAFMVILSATVRDVSLTYRGEVRLHKLKGKDLGRFHPDVMGKFRERAELAIQRIPQIPSSSEVVVEEGDVRHLPFEDGAFSAIVTSPPYGDDRNGVGYFQFSKNMLYWLGYTENQIREAKMNFMGDVKVGKAAPESHTLHKVIEQIRDNPIPSNPNAESEAVAFYDDYQRALGEMTRVCEGPIAVVIGDRTLSQTFIDNANITTELMSNLDWKLREYYHRVIEKKRIPVMLPGGHQRDRSGGGLINKEHTLVYERN